MYRGSVGFLTASLGFFSVISGLALPSSRDRRLDGHACLFMMEGDNTNMVVWRLRGIHYFLGPCGGEGGREGCMQALSACSVSRPTGAGCFPPSNGSFLPSDSV